ncbi:LOW QUALITY PROTEIN: hypothetical protein MXB_3420, partial [Myxobolus squamalis]
GKFFLTTKETLRSEIPSKLADLVDDLECDRDEEGSIMLDRDPDLFRFILSYLRTKHVQIKKHMDLNVIAILGYSSVVLTNEAKYFGLQELVANLNALKGGKSLDVFCREIKHRMCAAHIESCP